MDSKIKKIADSGDINSLRFIFIDSFDADPTFEKYKEDFEYCKNIPGLFVPHKELTPFTSDQSKWDEDYWFKIKMDMEENYSIERFNHMKEVAKVFYADKIKRLIAERAAKAEVKTQPAANPVMPESKPLAPNPTAAEAKPPVSRTEPVSSNARRYERVVKTYSEPSNTQTNQSYQRQANAPQTQRTPSNGNSPKKALGIVLAVAVLAVIVILLVFLNR